MEYKNTLRQSGGLQISVPAVEKIARLSAMEVEEVNDVSEALTALRDCLQKQICQRR